MKIIVFCAFFFPLPVSVRLHGPHVLGDVEPAHHPIRSTAPRGGPQR